MTAAPRLLAEGRPEVKAYQHVGYVVGGVLEMHQVPARPGLSGGLYGAAAGLLLLALASRRGRRWVARLLYVGAALMAPTALRVGAERRRVLRPETITVLQTMERLSAATEAQAVSLGRWPTPEEWRTAHGEPVTPGGKPLHYDLAPPPNRRDDGDPRAPFKAYAIWADDRDLAPGYVWCDSRAAGADGLFGTADDGQVVHWLRASYLDQPAWPHARAPRDPNVKLPAWPAERTGAIRAES